MTRYLSGGWNHGASVRPQQVQRSVALVIAAAIRRWRVILPDERIRRHSVQVGERGFIGQLLEVVTGECQWVAVMSVPTTPLIATKRRALPQPR